MARIFQTGFELNSTTSNVELESFDGTSSVQTSVVRSGTYAARTNPTSGTGSFQLTFDFGGTQGGKFCRFYLRIASAPSADTTIMEYANSIKKAVLTAGLKLTTTRTLQLWNLEDSAQVGSDSSALDLDTWYRIEIKLDDTTLSSSAVDALIVGSSFASGTINLATVSQAIRIGTVTSSITTDLFFDDIAFNDDVGSFQNSFPGDGKIIHLKPNATGDNSDWTNTFANVDEVTPDDASTIVESNTATEIDDYNLDATPATIGSGDTINVVALAVRQQRAGASPALFRMRIKASGGGTVEESSELTPGSTFQSFGPTGLENYLFVLYDLPGASTTEWTKADLDVAQAGYIISTGGTDAVQISTLWVSVDFTQTTLEVDVNDSISIADVLEYFDGETVTITENIQILQTGPGVTYGVVVNDTITITDVPTDIDMSVAVNVNDSVSIAELVTVGSTIFISTNEAITITEDITNGVIINIDKGGFILAPQIF